MENFKFIDIFAGIGGFHQALKQLGGECVFASEIDKNCNVVYKNNYNIESGVNIRDVEAKDIPKHDVAAFGFPCQPFSKAGEQKGFEDKIKGTLFFEIVRILKEHHTKYIILENVKNLITHDDGNTWKVIQESLKELGYRTTKEPLILSPHQFGIPQIRERVIILGKYEPQHTNIPLDITFDNLLSKEDNSIYDILEEDVDDISYNISEYENMVLTAWDEFYQGINIKTIGFPIWADYFQYTGKIEQFPKWKQGFINKNKNLYDNNKEFIDEWLKKYNNLKDFNPSHRKMEWQCGTSISSLWDGIIQFRPSGVRIKKPNCFQTLVAMVQTPIIGKYKRRLTVREAARLQSFPDDFKIDENKQQAYKQFGNSVNVIVIKKALEQLFQCKENEK